MSDETKEKITKVRALPMPSENFDPLVADSELLVHFGFPKRPDHERAPDVFKRWKRLFAGSMTRIEPVFIFPTNPIYTSKPRFPPSRKAPWSGAVVSGESTPNRYAAIVGEW